MLVRRLSPWIVLGLAVAARVAVWAEWRAWPGSAVPVLDVAWHMALAERIAGGDLAAGDQTWAVAPGTAYLFALARVLGGPGTAAPAALLLLCDLGLVEAIRRLGGRLAGPWGGLVAGVTAALAAPLPFHAVALLGVSPSALLLGLAILATLVAAPGVALLGGLALGLSCWLRPNQLVLLPIFLMGAAWPAGAAWPSLRGWPRALLLALGFALALLPGLARNRAVGGEWVPLSANAGSNLYMAHEPGSWSVEATPPPGPANLDYLIPWFHDAAERAQGRPLKPGEADAYWMTQARARVEADPQGALERAFGRFYAALATWGHHDHYAYLAHRRDQPALGSLPDPSWLLPGLAAIGALLCWRAGHRREAALLVGLWLGIAASLAPFSVVERYRLSALVATIPLAAAGLVRGLSERQWRLLLAAPVVSLLFSVDPFKGRFVLPDLLAGGPALSWTEHAGTSREAMEASNIGAAFVRERRPAEAEPFLRRALALDPARWDDRVSLAGLLIGSGRTDEGLGELEAVLAAVPQHPAAALTRCTALLQAGRPAVDACAQAARAAPRSWEAWYQLALARWEAGDPAGALADLERASSLDSGNTRVGALLARMRDVPLIAPTGTAAGRIGD